MLVYTFLTASQVQCESKITQIFPYLFVLKVVFFIIFFSCLVNGKILKVSDNAGMSCRNEVDLQATFERSNQRSESLIVCLCCLFGCRLTEWHYTWCHRIPGVQNEPCAAGRLWLPGWSYPCPGAHGSLCSCCHAWLWPPWKNQCLSSSYQCTTGK